MEHFLGGPKELDESHRGLTEQLFHQDQKIVLFIEGFFKLFNGHI